MNTEYDKTQFEKYNKELKKIVIFLENNSTIKKIDMDDLENTLKFSNNVSRTVIFSTEMAYIITEVYNAVDHIVNQNKLQYHKNALRKMRWDTLFENFRAILSIFKTVTFSCMNPVENLNHFSISFYTNLQEIYLESCPPSTVKIDKIRNFN